jgi:polyhydroxybutyrate depolymerase
MLGWLDEHACVDRARVFAIGYSNGGQFANVLACERAGVVAGIAVAAGRLNCSPASSMPVVMSHGLADRTIGYAQAVEASKTWAAANACTAPPDAGVQGCVAASACADAPVVLCTHAGGHEYHLPFTATAVEFFRGQAGTAAR